MKILLIHNFYQYYGGEDIYVTSLKRLLENNGHKVYLYFKDSKNIKTFWDKIKTTIGFFYNPQVKKELAEIIKEFKPDIAHFNNIYPLISPISYRICKQYSIPIVQHIHNYRFMCPKGILFRNKKICELCLHKKFPLYSIIFGCYHKSHLASLFFSIASYYNRHIRTFDLINSFIFQAKFISNNFINETKIDISKSEILPHFVPSTNFYLNKKKNFFIYVGRLSEEKGVIELLEVFKTINNIKLIVIGDGPLKKHISVYKKYKNIKIINFLKRNKILELMSKAKATIIPSLFYETGPFTLMESYSVGTPVIAPKLGVFIDKVVYTGLLYEKGSDNLKRSIFYLHKNKDKIKQMSKNSRKEYIKMYTEMNHLNILIKIYKKINKRYKGE